MRTSGLQLWAIVLACMFLGSAAAASVSKNVVKSESAEPKPMAGTSPRVVLLEMFTGTWCTWCGVIKPAISRLLDEFGPDRLLMIAYHAYAGSGDPYQDTTIYGPRQDFYQQPFGGYPTTVIDGGGYTTGTSLFAVGSQGTTPADYNFYKGKTVTELTKYTNIQITLSGDLTPTSATVTALVYASDPITETNLKIRFALYEDTLYATQTNGPPVHKYVVRALAETPFIISQGETQSFTHAFTPQAAWDKNRMGVIAFVQDDARRSYACGSSTCYNSPVIQAARYQFVQQNTLYVRDDDVTDMTVAPLRGEFMEAALSQAVRPFDVWNTFSQTLDTGTNDERGTPNLLKLEEYGAVIWSTGSATSILTPGNVADLSGYLDGYGNLYIHGENVATDLSTSNPTFLDGYLHAALGPSSTAATFMNGVAGDPITGAWTATNLAFAGTSPDNVDPTATSVTILNYPGLISAGVRATHDANSRVVTSGQNYYQGTDTRKATMVGNVLDWLDGAGGPRVTLITPNGGEEYSPGDNVAIRWSAIDVEIPVDAVDISFTSTLSAPSWQLLTSSEPNDGLYWWSVPSVNTNDCGIQIVVRDGDPMTPDGIATSAAPCTIGYPDVSLTKAVSNPIPQAGEVITYTITLTNAGPLAGYATATDALPAGVTYLSDDGGLTGVSAYFAGNTTAVWTGIVPPLSNVIWHISATVLAGPPGTLVKNWAFFNSTSRLGGSAQSGNSRADFQIPALENWQLILPVGKRFVSIPILLADYRVEIVLASIATKYSYVRQYDRNDPSSPWKSYEPGRIYNTLTHLRPETGFWIEMASAGTLNVVGARAGSTEIWMKAGWNMVGYPSLTTGFTVAQMKASIALPNIVVEGFDPTSPPYNLWVLPDTYVLTAGEGYWVYIPADATWHVTG
jgi:uncharacterized repeat protein (TIGR01451 family)